MSRAKPCSSRITSYNVCYTKLLRYTPARQEFAGYPPGDTSPYKLPYVQGKALFVGQANQGMFSHMRFNWLPQVYAYDFAHDFGEEILATRGGTVVDFFDWIEDDIQPNNTQMTNASYNFV